MVKQPIVIYPFIEVNYHFEAPNNWNPLTMPMVNLQKVVDATNSNLDKMANPYYWSQQHIYYALIFLKQM